MITKERLEARLKELGGELTKCENYIRQMQAKGTSIEGAIIVVRQLLAEIDSQSPGNSEQAAEAQ
jgi:hypothetical protein